MEDLPSTRPGGRECDGAFSEHAQQRLGGMKIQVVFGVLLLEQMVPGIWVQWQAGESQIAEGLACQAKKHGLDPVKQVIAVKGFKAGR